MSDWVLVPRIPTPEMCRAAKWALERAKERDCKLQDPRPYTAEEKHAIRWAAMLEASPQSLAEPLAGQEKAAPKDGSN